ncbi:MAG: TIGR04222 domain-containing membrane protein [Alphaproteobacteria bacterium]|nr:TIGR04222 domain-containing membrane protein [Alphaproteobacteria bacterium]
MTASPWTPELHALWTRLQDHPFEDEDLALDLTARLAREQRWSRAYAMRAVDAYRRFCFLAVAAGVPATPSVDVDEVWHLHLLYTRDYWDVFCPTVLGTTLHHGPTRGGRAEGHRFGRQYADTLAAHEAFFGVPDPDLWPSAAERFRRPGRFRRVDTDRAWVIPHPRLPSVRVAGAFAGLAMLLLLAGTAHAAGLGPFDLAGPPFLALYVVLGVVAVATSRPLRDLARRAPAADARDLTPYELAWLGGGARRCVEVAAADLVARGVAEVGDDGDLRLTAPTDALPWPLPELVPMVLRDEPVEGAEALLEVLPATLTARGLLLDRAGRWRAKVLAALPLVGLIGFGVVKMWIGASRDRPIGFLALLVFFTLVLTFMAVVGVGQRTRAGDDAVKAARRAHDRAVRAPLPHELPLAVALVGFPAMIATPLEDWHRVLFPMPVVDAGGDVGIATGGGCGGGGGGGGGCGG